ncbi:MAG: GntR family transcriptional regulator [Nitriliruptorales bacterium]|nr:GntR family transcriptional regulator [Nitriliruptorales bacterium]
MAPPAADRNGTGPRALDRNDPLPLWAQMARDVRRRIAAGEFREHFPTEAEFGEQYDVSRHTVREVLRRLRDEGLVVAERGRGSYLTATRFDQPLGTIYSLYEAIESQGIEQRSVVRRLERTTNPEVAAILQLQPQDGLVVLERLRLAGGEALALDTVWLPAELATPLLDVDFERTALYTELANACDVRIDAGHERIAPVVPDADERRLLELEEGAAAFRVRRETSSQGEPVELRVTLIRGDRYCFVASWSAASAYELDLVPTGAIAT